MPRLFAYGLLRLGQSGHQLLDGCPCIAQHIECKGYEMFAGPEYPFVLLSDANQHNSIWGDLFEIPNELLPTLDQYEDVHSGLYYRYFDPKNNFYVYIAGQAEIKNSYPKIKTGDWVRWINNR